MVIINDRRRDVTTINRVIIIMVVGIVTSAMTVLRTNLEVEVVRDILDLKKMPRITSATPSTLRDSHTTISVVMKSQWKCLMNHLRK